MPSFFLAMLAVFAASLGARDQLLVARQSASLGAANGLLVTGCLTAIVSAALMAWGGETVAALLPASAKTMLVAIALLFAALELLWPIRMKRAAEPTHSLGALAFVLFARQFGDAARFCVFALAASTGSATLTGIGGAFGGVAAITLGWLAGARLEQAVPLRMIRIAMGVITLIAAIVIGLIARGLIG